MFFIKKNCHKAISMLLIMTMVFTSVLGLTGCKKDEETKVETIETTETESEEVKNTDEVVKDLDKIYECELVMGEGMTMMLYLKIDKDGNFVFSRNTDFSSDEKGAGKVYKNEDGEYYLEYAVVNGEEVEPGEYVSKFEIGEDDQIIFTSQMWFGSTTPHFEEDGKVTYPEFIVSDEEEIGESETESETEEEEKTGKASDFSTGTYGGTYTTTAMGNPLTYSVTVYFGSNNTYSYTVKFHIMGSTRTESESGTYKQNGTTITMTSNSGTTTTAKVTGSGELVLTRYISSFAFSSATVYLTHGYAPGVVINGSNSGSTDTDNDNETPGTSDIENQGGSENDTPEIDDSVTELIGGTYAVDISWSPMAAMMSPILDVDAEIMTFDIYNKTAPNASKGSGTITEKDGVYTLNYDNGNKTTFTIAGGVITFTSPLYYGTAAFNSATVSGGDFVPYTATVTKVDGTVPEQPGESEEESESESESESETESEPEVEEYKVSAGTYEGTHTKVAMGSTIEYVCTLELKEDGTYVYGVKFVMGGNEYTSEEKGTYTVANNVLTLKTDAPMSSKDDAAENTATVKADDTFTLNRYISGMASNKEDVDYTLSDVKFVTGTYGGEYTNVSSSGKETDYVYTLTFNEDNTYVYTASFAMGTTTYTQTEQGSYAAENGVFTLTSAELKVTDPDGNVAIENTKVAEMSGVIDEEGKALLIERYVSYFAEMSGSKANLTLAYGYTPSLDTDNDDSTNNDSAPGLVSGAYAVDTSFAQMAAMLAPVVEINAEAMTFNVYKASDPATSRGSGTITYAEGVYTLTFDNGNTTTFTYADRVITFTSKLWFGTANLNNPDADGNFVPYTASLGSSASVMMLSAFEDEVTEETLTETEAEVPVEPAAAA